MHSRTRQSNVRLLLIAHEIANGQHNAVSLSKKLDMTKSYAVQCISRLSDMGIDVQFVGPRTAGYYELLSWGWNDPEYLAKNYDDLRQELRESL